MTEEKPIAGDCAIDGCGRLAHSGGRYCAGHAKRIERGSTSAAPLRQHLPLRERVLKLSLDLADADSEDDGAYEKAWDNLEHAMSKWGDVIKARRGGVARSAILSPERRRQIARIGWTAWFTATPPDERREHARRGGNARTQVQPSLREIGKLGGTASSLASKRAAARKKGKRRQGGR